MSGFMFGGSALTLDVGVKNNTVQPVVAGDVLQVDLTQAIDATSKESTSDGLAAIQAGSGDASIGNYSITGVVLAPAGHSIAAGENCIIRVMGIVDVQGVAGAGYTTGHLLTPTNSLTPSASSPIKLTVDASVAPNLASTLTSADFKAKAVCLESRTLTSDGGTIKAWFKGFPL
tara:strand:- start:252 stop:773 length:522 start_codon:yes stop_codon:yes gene_type:complete